MAEIEHIGQNIHMDNYLHTHHLMTNNRKKNIHCDIDIHRIKKQAHQCILKFTHTKAKSCELAIQIEQLNRKLAASTRELNEMRKQLLDEKKTCVKYRSAGDKRKESSSSDEKLLADSRLMRNYGNTVVLVQKFKEEFSEIQDRQLILSNELQVLRKFLHDYVSIFRNSPSFEKKARSESLLGDYANYLLVEQIGS